jgi:multisubunit Na+/H+ antiporter MnhG subunit
VRAVRTLRTKAEHIVLTYFKRIIVPKYTRASVEVVAQLAEPLVVVGTTLCLFELGTLFGLRVTINAIFLLVANPVLLDELTNWHLGHVVLVQEVTFVALLAGVAQPVNAHLLLALLITDLVRVR